MDGAVGVKCDEVASKKSKMMSSVQPFSLTSFGCTNTLFLDQIRNRKRNRVKKSVHNFNG